MKDMRKTLGILMVMGLVLLLGFVSAYAAIPYTINYQGYLTDSGGNPKNGPVTMKFSLYTVLSGGTDFWNETQSVTVNEGVYSVTLGTVNQTLGSYNFDVPYFLGVTVGTDAEMTPRQPLTSVAYAFTADTALNVANNVITSPMIQDGSVSSADVNFNYAGSTSKGGPATGLVCAACVSQTELDFAPLLTEADPQVGTLTNGKWCLSNGTLITCTQDPPALANHNHDAAYVNVSGDTMTGALSVGGNISTDGVYRFGESTVLSTPGGFNTFLGHYTGSSNTTGNYNTFIGRAAGNSNIGGSNNAFLGVYTGYKNTSGNENTFLGYAAGYSNTTGGYNTFVGRNAGYFNTDTASNTFIGYSAGYKNTTGTYNTFVGRDAGYSNDVGDSLTFVGRDAGYSNTIGYSNTFIRRAAGYLNTDGNNNTFIGRYAGYSNDTGISNTFIGTAAGYSNTGNGNTYVGDEAGYSNTTGDSNTFIGTSAGHSSTGDYNTFIGRSAGLHNTGSDNVFIGYDAGRNETGSNKLYIENTNISTPLIYGDFSTRDVTIYGDFSATGTKSFIQPHAKDPSKELVYVATEAPEAVVMYRGAGELKDGIAVIELPEYFSVVAAEEGLQVQVTPNSTDTYGLAVVEKNRQRILVKELMNRKGNFKFDYLITAIRAGYEDHKPVVANTSFRPKENETAHAFAARYSGDDTNTKAIRAMLISNGILTKDGELNMKMVKELGWTVKETDLARFEE